MPERAEECRAVSGSNYKEAQPKFFPEKRQSWLFQKGHDLAEGNSLRASEYLRALAILEATTRRPSLPRPILAAYIMLAVSSNELYRLLMVRIKRLNRENRDLGRELAEFEKRTRGRKLSDSEKACAFARASQSETLLRQLTELTGIGDNVKQTMHALDKILRGLH